MNSKKQRTYYTEIKKTINKLNPSTFWNTNRLILIREKCKLNMELAKAN